jgi:hypothetical protein
MFELCMQEPDALARHKTAPLVLERERFIAHLHECGTSKVNMRSAAAHLLRFVRVLPMPKRQDVSEAELTPWDRSNRIEITSKKCGGWD